MDYEQLLVKRYRYWGLYLSEFQAYLGRCYLALNREGDLDPFLDVSEEEWQELKAIIKNELAPTLHTLFSPDKLNYAGLRNDWPHCHWHIVPRYATSREFAGYLFTDHNHKKNWSPYDKTFTLPPEVMQALREMLIAALP